MKKQIKNSIFLSFILFALLTFFACSKSSNSSTSKPTIIVSVSPYNVWVKEIVGDTAHVVCAIPPKFNPHIYEASPKDMAKFKSATLWFSLGDPVERKLIKTVSEHQKNLKTIDISNNLPLQNYKELPGPDIFNNT